MARPTFTWTVVPPNHLVQSVCNSCTRMIGVTANRGLLHVLESVHDCGTSHDKTPPPRSPQNGHKPSVH